MKQCFYLIVCLFLLGIISCVEKLDFFDENVITGNVGPQAYWEIGSSAVSAGTNMPFTVQYYTTAADIDHSEVWYNVVETIEKSVSCPWVTTFTYSVASTQSEEKRISQKIQEYSHSLAVWSDSLHAYTFKAEFPISNTLKTFLWTNPEATFDYDKMNTYFGEGFAKQFKDSLPTLMKYADYKKMMSEMGLVENFDKDYNHPYYDEASGSDIDAFEEVPAGSGNRPVPDAIKALYESIPFDHLIENATGGYNVLYKRTYKSNAILRVYDKKGIYGLAVTKEFDII
ncbi:hypothetical protein FACS1894182_07580 [Bacteroidia bacterium]|nr:hypothetical protein FACS1894182_07580 [Bacteroidia bacterium]